MLYVVNGGIAAVSLTVALMARHDRWRLSQCALAMLLLWALYALSWHPDYSPAVLLDASSGDLWSVYDTIVALYVLAVAHRRWWGWALFATLSAEVAAHALYWQTGALPWPVYRRTLDAMFLAQNAIIWVKGGPSVADFLHRASRSGRSVLDPLRRALSKEVARHGG